MRDLPTLEAALKLADQDSPLPSLAGPALKVLRTAINGASEQLKQIVFNLDRGCDGDMDERVDHALEILNGKQPACGSDKALCDHINQLERESTLSRVARGKLKYLLERGARQFGVAVTTDWDRRIAVLSSAGKVLWFNPREASETDSATLTALIAELRAREALGRVKYGTDVDRVDLTNAQWRQHLREELMDALLYSLAEERTQPLPPLTPEDC